MNVFTQRGYGYRGMTTDRPNDLLDYAVFKFVNDATGRTIDLL